MARNGIEEVVAFYEMHPISEQQIMEKLNAEGVDISQLGEETLRRHDQDHFGGVEANDTLAAWAGISERSHVLDVCCGLGGPARYLAAEHGCRLTGIDLTESRIEGARRLTKLTGLDHLVTFQAGNALEMPFEDGAFDVVMAQEAFCHVPGKSILIGECARVLRRGGRMVFTDIVTTKRTETSTRERLEREMAFRELASADQYYGLLETAGFTVTRHEDLGEQWRGILRDRLAMYRSLCEQTVERFGRPHFEKWDSAYAFFVGCYETGELSGTRIISIR